MNTIIVWLLVATMSTGSSGSSVTVIDTFPTEADCDRTRQVIETKSENARWMKTIKGICVEAKVVRYGK